MKPITNFITMLAPILLFAACGNSEKTTAEHTAKEVHTDAITEKQVSKVTLKDDQLNAIYPHYLALTNALVNGDVTEVKVAVNAIELGSKALSDGAELAVLSAKIGAAKDIDSQRALYADLSTNLIAKIKRAGLNAGEIYIAYCPMALEDTGAVWLSNQKEIRNPYFGESMMTCGEVKETL
jgi:hypothetical protein